MIISSVVVATNAQYVYSVVQRLTLRIDPSSALG